MVPRRLSRREFRISLGTLAVLAAIVSLVVKTGVFPHFSLNHDEAVYLQQANALLEGQLRLYPPVEDAFRPWFFVDAGDSLYSKYSPVTPVLYAASKLVTGSYIGALPVMAAGLTALTGAVVAEVFDRRVGIVAAGLMVMSPMFVVQSATFLPYAPTLLLELGFAWCYLRSERLDHRGYAVAAGALIGTAFFARPYTAILFGTPFIVHALTRIGATYPDRAVATRLGLTAVTGFVGVVLALGYNWVVTGDPLLFPYQAFAPLDGVGFGRRELLGYTRYYDLGLAIESNLVALEMYVTEWVVGGLLTVVLAVVGVVIGLRDRVQVGLPGTYSVVQARVLLVGVVVSVVVGNLWFWGTLNAVGNLDDPGGLATFLGPYYHLDLLVPTVAFAAAALVTGFEYLESVGTDHLDPRYVRVGVLLAAVGAVMVLGVATVGAADDIYDRNMGVTQTYESAYAPLEDREFESAVLLVPRVYGGWLNHPFQTFRNDADFDGEVVYALRETNTFDVVEAYPGRELYRYEYRGVWSPATSAEVTAALEPVAYRSGQRVTVGVDIGVPAAYESVSVVVGNGSEQATYAVDWTGDAASLDLVFTAEGVRLVGGELVTGAEPVPIQGDVEVRVFLDSGRGAGITYRLDVPVTVDDGRVEVLSPYAEVCADPRLCGGGAAAIPSTLPEGVFVETKVNSSSEAGG